VIIAIAEKFGQLPETIESQLTEYWFNRIVVQMDAQTIDAERRERERERK